MFTPTQQRMIGDIDTWLDTAVGVDYLTMPLAQTWARVGKIGEEYGEAINALIGMTGQNPRKGIYATMYDLEREVADVVFTGILALMHLTKDANTVDAILTSHLAKLHGRVPRLGE
jgi:hypothetical protein